MNQSTNYFLDYNLMHHLIIDLHEIYLIHDLVDLKMLDWQEEILQKKIKYNSFL